MAIGDMFLNHFETSDNPKDTRLKSHYYGNDYQNTQNAISTVFQSSGYKLINVDNKYNEMLFEQKKIKITVAICKVSLCETRVDLIINTSYIFPLGRGMKIVDELYRQLDKKLTLKQRGASYE